MLLLLLCAIGLALWFTLITSKVSPLYSSAITSPIKILFIGDSFTFKNNMPAILQGMLGSNYIVDMEAEPARTLDTAYGETQHVINMIKNGGYTYVILQDRSSEAFLGNVKFEQVIPKFVSLITQSGATPVLFEPWTYRSDAPEYGASGYCSMLSHSPIYSVLCDGGTTSPAKVQQWLKQEYTKIGAANGIAVVYVGEAFWAVDDREKLLFNVCDAMHPTLAGTYLIALMFWQFLTKGDVTNISTPLTSCVDCATMTSPGSGCLDCCANIRTACSSCLKVMGTLDPLIMKRLQTVASEFK
jgi:hypothetical protein